MIELGEKIIGLDKEAKLLSKELKAQKLIHVQGKTSACSWFPDSG